MADLSDAQRKRAEARKRRRSQTDEEPEASADNGGQEQHDAIKQAAKVAAAVGAAGAAAAAARALTSHGDDAEPEASEPEEPQAGSEEPQEQEEQEPEPEQEPEQEHQPEQEPEQEQPAEEPVAGAGPSEARQALDRAREQLQDLLEQPVEKVSSLERTHDGWVAQLEVVELKRIPESTDVMGSYELELDDELNLRRYQQARRYTRSQASRDEGA
jgi:hypothetical protein